MRKKPTSGSAREAKLARARKEQKAAERRRTALIVGATGIAIAFILGAVGWAIVSGSDERQAGADLAGVQQYEYSGGDHVQSEVDYAESPPVGGKHNPVWLNCGVYEEPVSDENAVHSLEHGAVWITYEPDLSRNEVQKLAEALPDTYTLLSPFEGDMPSPIVVSAWGHQLELDSAEDRRLTGFIKEYRQGPQTPEPGAACTGGVGAEGA